jgi:hypothetical protein
VTVVWIAASPRDSLSKKDYRIAHNDEIFDWDRLTHLIVWRVDAVVGKHGICAHKKPLLRNEVRGKAHWER